MNCSLNKHIFSLVTKLQRLRFNYQQMGNNMVQLDYVANLICEVYKEAGLDAEYIENKKSILIEYQDKYRSLASAIRLDQGNKHRLARKLGCSFQALQTTIEVMNYKA